jgi:hypothetical protein
MTANRFGLPRNIDAATKRVVRQRCGFGCAICGGFPFIYDHVDPQWVDATRHDPERIALLCGTCNDKKTRGLIAVTTVFAAMANPAARRAGFSWSSLPPDGRPIIDIGSTLFEDLAVVAHIMGEDILRIDAPEAPGAPYRVNATFFSEDDGDYLKIVDNEWQCATGNWDAEIVGQRLTVRRAAREVVLQIRFDPPRTLVVETLVMTFKGASAVVKDGKACLTRPNGASTTLWANPLKSCNYGIIITAERFALGATSPLPRGKPGLPGILRSKSVDGTAS